MTDPDPARHPTLGRVVMVIPTYNEVSNLAWIVGRLRRAHPEIDVLVVDDDSPDGTGRVADELAEADPQLHVLHRAAKGGLGAAYLHGFTWALEEGYDVIGEMDADGSHQPEELHLLLNALETADLVIGSRWVPGGSVTNWPARRELLSRGGNAYVRLLLGIDVRDATAGFRLFRRATLEKIDLRQVRSAGYVFQTDLVARTLRSGLTVREVPIEFVERVRGRVQDEPVRGGGVPAPDHRLGRARTRRAGTPGGQRQGRGALMARRRRGLGWLLFVAFVVVPIVEIYVLIQVGQVIGVWWTILLLIADSILGTWLIRREGGRAWQAMRTALDSGRMPAQGARRRRADPGRRHPDAEPRLRHRRVRHPADPAVHPAALPAAAHRRRRPPTRRDRHRTRKCDSPRTPFTGNGDPGRGGRRPRAGS